MRLLFLGTAASEGYPDAFCACDNCQRARVAGGPNLRKRSSVLIDDVLLIDLGPDLMAAAQQHGVSLAGIQYCLQTHEHEDHQDPSHFLSRSQFCGVHGNPRLHYYASRNAIERAAQLLGGLAALDKGLLNAELAERLNLQAHPIAPFSTFDAGPYRVTSVAANHAPETTAMLFVIERAGRVLFYATDTGDFPETTWQALARYPSQINTLVLDHTFGLRHRDSGHMNIEQFVEHITRMREAHLLASDALVYAHHLAHHSNPLHEELLARATPHGYSVAYDGLAIEV